MTLNAAYGLLAHGLLFGALTALLPFGALRARVALAATTLALLVGIAPGLHGLFGAPSATLVALGIRQLAGHTPSPLSPRAAGSLGLFLLIYYPSALGWGSFDPYALGFQPAALIALLLPAGLLLWWRRQYGWAAILGIDLLAWAGGVFANLWDALFDPLLALLAAAVLARQGYIRFIASRRR